MDSTISAAMLEANRRLYELRSQLGIGREGGAGETAARPGVPHSSFSHSLISSNNPANESVNDATTDANATHGLLALVATLPPHLGWGSETLTKHLRKLRVTSDELRVQDSSLDTRHSSLDDPDSSLDTRHSTLVTRHSSLVAHPSILLAALRAGKEAPARVYLLLRAIDRDGRGWLTVDEARARLTGQDSPLRVAGWRRLRQLLREGEGLFWKRDRERLWLIGTHKIACKLGLARLQGYSVELPVQALLGGIQAVRATFYAAFHAGRESKPISRATLADLSGVPGRTQLEYDRVARVIRTRHFAVGDRYTAAAFQERAWGHGRAVFRFEDARGRQGGPGGKYVAWTLPNSYRADYPRRSGGNRKRLNRKLADLLPKGTAGNDGPAMEKRFFPNAALAARRYNRHPESDAYWRTEGGTRAGDGLWCVLAGAGG